MNKTRFPLGQLVATPGAIEAVPRHEMLQAVFRHASGDWGNCCPEDAELNDAAVEDGTRILSVYETAAGAKFWIITEADRSSTCVLLPDEY